MTSEVDLWTISYHVDSNTCLTGTRETLKKMAIANSSVTLFFVTWEWVVTRVVVALLYCMSNNLQLMQLLECLLSHLIKWRGFHSFNCQNNWPEIFSIANVRTCLFKMLQISHIKIHRIEWLMINCLQGKKSSDSLVRDLWDWPIMYAAGQIVCVCYVWTNY